MTARSMVAEISHFASSPITGAVVEKQGRAGDTKSTTLGVVAAVAATPRENVPKSDIEWHDWDQASAPPKK